MSSNDTLEVEIGPGLLPGRYLVRVVRAPTGGEPQAATTLPLEQLLDRRELLQQLLVASSYLSRAPGPPEERPLRETGQQLFEALFPPGAVELAYRSSLAVARDHAQRLRVVLRVTDPALAALPWEAMWDPDAQQRSYVCRQEPLVRHVPAPYSPPPITVDGPLRILGLVASPRGLPLLDSDAEREHLKTALDPQICAGRARLEWVTEASWTGLLQRLIAGPCHVLHFIGHGDYDETAGEGRLALVGPNGRADWVEAGRLADLLSEADPSPQLVVLNSCASAEGGVADLMSGTAAVLVHSGISAVAAMQFSISDRAAVAFPQGFYAALAGGRPVDEAMRAGRMAILGIPHSLEWVTPVLYLRGDAARLFAVAPPGDADGDVGHALDDSHAATDLVTELGPSGDEELHQATTGRQTEQPTTSGALAAGGEQPLVHPAESETAPLRARRLATIKQSNILFDLAWHPGGKVLALATAASKILVYGADGDRRPGLKSGGFMNGPHNIVFSPNGSRLASGHERGVFCIFDTSSFGGIGRPLHKLNHGGDVTTVAFSPDSHKLVSACRDSTVIRVWDASEGVVSIQAIEQRALVKSVAFGIDDQTLVVGAGKEARIWDRSHGTVVRTITHDADVTTVLLNRGGLAASGDIGCHAVRIWDPATGETKQLLEHNAAASPIAFSPDSKRLATCDGERVAIWDLTREQRLWAADAQVAAVLFLPDVTLIAAGEGYNVTVWAI